LFETFLAQFQNCAAFNKWASAEQLAFLRGSLEKEAVQTLWDYNTEEVNTVSKLVRKLQKCFGRATEPGRARQLICWK